MRFYQALGALIMASIFYTILNILIKLAMVNYHIPWQQVAFLRCIVSAIILLILILGQRQSLKPTNLYLLIARSITGFLMLMSWVFALKYLPVTNTVLLINCAPIFIIALGGLFFHKNISKIDLICISFGLIGISLVLHPNLSDFHSLISFIALFSGLSLAAGLIIIKKLRVNTSGKIIAFYYYFLCSFYCAPFAFLNWHSLDILCWLIIMLSGVTSVGYQLLMAAALKNISAKMASLGLYLAIVFSSISDYVIWHIRLTDLIILGTIFIIASSLIAAIQEFKDNKIKNGLRL